MAEIRQLIQDSLQMSSQLLEFTEDTAVENHIQKINFLRNFFAQLLYKYDLPVEFLQDLLQVDGMLTNKNVKLECRLMNMTNTIKVNRGMNF